MSTEYPLARALSDEGINENHNCICLGNLYITSTYLYYNYHNI